MKCPTQATEHTTQWSVGLGRLPLAAVEVEAGVSASLAQRQLPVHEAWRGRPWPRRRGAVAHCNTLCLLLLSW